MLLGGHVEINEAEVHICKNHGERPGQLRGCHVGSGCCAEDRAGIGDVVRSCTDARSMASRQRQPPRIVGAE